MPSGFISGKKDELTITRKLPDGTTMTIKSPMEAEMMAGNAGFMNAPTNPEAGPDDTVPAMLTPGEAVIPAERAQDADAKPIINQLIQEGRAEQATQGYNKGTLGAKISKIHGEGYTAPGQAYAIAKSMGYNQGTPHVTQYYGQPGVRDTMDPRAHKNVGFLQKLKNYGEANRADPNKQAAALGLLNQGLTQALGAQGYEKGTEQVPYNYGGQRYAAGYQAGVPEVPQNAYDDYEEARFQMRIAKKQGASKEVLKQWEDYIDLLGERVTLENSKDNYSTNSPGWAAYTEGQKIRKLQTNALGYQAGTSGFDPDYHRRLISDPSAPAAVRQQAQQELKKHEDDKYGFFGVRPGQEGIDRATRQAGALQLLGTGLALASGADKDIASQLGQQLGGLQGARAERAYDQLKKAEKQYAPSDLEKRVQFIQTRDDLNAEQKKQAIDALYFPHEAEVRATAGKERAKDDAKALVDSQEQYNEASQEITQIQNLSELYNQVQTGGLSGNRYVIAVKQFANEVYPGISEDITNVEQARVIQQQLVLRERAKLRGQGTITDNETRLLENTLPNLTNTNEANQLILALRLQGNLRIKDINEAWLNTTPKEREIGFGEWKARYIRDNRERWDEESEVFFSKFANAAAVDGATAGANERGLSDPTQEQYDALPDGATYTYQGKTYVKGR